MLLRDNRGALRTVTEVIPAVEKREVFNGEKRCFLDSEPLFVEVIPDENVKVNPSDKIVDDIGGMAVGIVDDYIEDETATGDEITENGGASVEEEVCADEESA